MYVHTFIPIHREIMYACIYAGVPESYVVEAYDASLKLSARIECMRHNC